MKSLSHSTADAKTVPSEVDDLTKGFNLWEPSKSDIQAYGAQKATEIADVRFLEHAFRVGRSEIGCEYYRKSGAPRHLLLQLEWAILSHDVLVSSALNLHTSIANNK
jgi:hypothetical protein